MRSLKWWKFFLAGVLVDLFRCSAVVAIAHSDAAAAAGLNGIYTGVCLFVNWRVIKDGDFGGAVAYVLGCTLGTYLSVIL
jgi:hypothetical protein